jgi:hypothetical protein
VLPGFFFIISALSIWIEESYFGQQDDAVVEQQLAILLNNRLDGVICDDLKLQYG